MRVLGVDGCRQGWIGVVLDSGRVVGVLFEEQLSELLSRTPEAECVGVDMPIGLVEESWREADLAARAFLGRRAATVFMVIIRAITEFFSLTLTIHMTFIIKMRCSIGNIRQH